MKKTALVLSGGGSRGSYEVGVYKALDTLGIKFDGVFGTSIGALNGALFIQVSADEAVRRWSKNKITNVFTEDFVQTLPNLDEVSVKDALYPVIKENILAKGVSNQNLEKFVRDNIEPETLYAEGQPELGICVYNFDKRKGEEILVQEMLKPEQVADFLVASSSCFPAIEMKTIDGVRYIDGGYYDNMPINFALKRGFEEIIAVDIKSPGFVKINPSGTNNVRIIMPKWDIGTVFDFKHDLTINNIMLGYLDTLKSYNYYGGNLYTFNLKSLSHLKQTRFLFTKSVNEFINNQNQYFQQFINVFLKANPNMLYDEGFVLNLIEQLAKSLGISPYETYDFDEFLRMIVKAADAIPVIEIIPLHLTKNLNQISNISVMIGLYHKIFNDNNLNYQTYMMSLSYYEETIQAFTLNLIKSYLNTFK